MKKTALIISILFFSFTFMAEKNYNDAIELASQYDSDGEISDIMKSYGFSTATGTPSDDFTVIDKFRALWKGL